MCAPTKQNAGFWRKPSKSHQVLHILLYGQAQLLFFSHWRGTLFAWRILYACTHGEVICKATSIFRHNYVDGCLKQLMLGPSQIWGLNVQGPLLFSFESLSCCTFLQDFVHKFWSINHSPSSSHIKIGVFVKFLQVFLHCFVTKRVLLLFP